MDRTAHELGCVAMTFNFRGCGESEGDVSLQGWVDDLRNAIAHVLSPACTSRPASSWWVRTRAENAHGSAESSLFERGGTPVASRPAVVVVPPGGDRTRLSAGASVSGTVKVTAPVYAAASEGTRLSWPIDGRDAAGAGGTAVLWFVVMALAARSVGFSVWSTSTWGRWRPCLFVDRRERLHLRELCRRRRTRPRTAWYWTVPRYPVGDAVRAAAGLLGTRRWGQACLALIVMVVAWSALWFGFCAAGRWLAGALGMVIAARSGGSGDDGDLPISSCSSRRRCAAVPRPATAGLVGTWAVGAAAAMTYTSGLLVWNDRRGVLAGAVGR